MEVCLRVMNIASRPPFLFGPGTRITAFSVTRQQPALHYIEETDWPWALL